MKALTTPQHYFDQTFFEAEKINVFEQTWQFVGFQFEIANHQDFLTRTIGNKAVVVQNFNGDLRAFLNVCSHRYSQIQDETQRCGNRPLRCPYHGWTFDSTGTPVGIPCQSDFEDLDPDAFKLTSFALETCGPFIFVRIAEEGPSLEQYFGDLYSNIKAIAEAMEDCVDQYVVQVPANWKLLVENSLEGYHVNFIHLKSIKQYGAGAKTDSETGKVVGHKFHFGFPHSWLIDAVEDNAFSKWQKIEPAYATRPFKTDTYHQYQVFPNLNVATFYGSAFFVQLFQPISPQETLVTHYSIRSKFNTPSKKDLALIHMTMENMVNMGKTILDEDIGICKMVQRGIQQNPNPTGVLCHEEERVYQYQRSYLAYLNNRQSLEAQWS